MLAFWHHAVNIEIGVVFTLLLTEANARYGGKKRSPFEFLETRHAQMRTKEMGVLVWLYISITFISSGPRSQFQTV